MIEIKNAERTNKEYKTAAKLFEKTLKDVDKLDRAERKDVIFALLQLWKSEYYGRFK